MKDLNNGDNATNGTSTNGENDVNELGKPNPHLKNGTSASRTNSVNQIGKPDPHLSSEVIASRTNDINELGEPDPNLSSEASTSKTIDTDELGKPGPYPRKENTAVNETSSAKASPITNRISPRGHKKGIQRRHSKTEMDLQAMTLGIQSAGLDINISKLIEPECFMARPKAKNNQEITVLSKKITDLAKFVKQHIFHVEDRLFEMFGNKDTQTINMNKFILGLISTGLRHDDPRLREMRENLKSVTAQQQGQLNIDYDTFMSIISDNIEIIVKALSSQFIIPDFRGLTTQIDDLYFRCKSNTNGKCASYIPQLERYSPDNWGVAICTVDGQRYSIGDVNEPFTIQSCSKPLTYALAAGEYGAKYVHSYVGMEPSGRNFNELCLDANNKPHNPMINAGAIMTASLVKRELSAADRFDWVFNQFKRLCGGEYLGFNNAVFLSERQCADRNFALAYYMKENKSFPEGTTVHDTLDFYFQLCSMEITAESGAVIAATLANGGINPLTGDNILTHEAVRNTLTLMHSCGMYNYSGEFAFKVGLPSKSGVSGCVLLVIPNTMGICLWSPPLDGFGNSCRSVQFCMELVNQFTFHHFDNLRGNTSTKKDPRMAKAESRAQMLFDLLFSAAAGDISALRRHSLSGDDMEAADYDGRTALHVAAAEGHSEVVEFLLDNCHVNPIPKDRWGRTPLDDSHSFGHPRCTELIIRYIDSKSITRPKLKLLPKTSIISIDKKENGVSDGNKED